MKLRTQTSRVAQAMRILMYPIIFSSLLFCTQTVSAQLVNSLPVNTGYDNSIGGTITVTTQDPNWVLTSATTPPFTLTGALPYNAYTTPSWTPPQPNSLWISYGSDRMTTNPGTGGEIDMVGGSLTFRREFTVCEEDDYIFDLTIQGDNYITDVNVDGTSIGSSTGTGSNWSPPYSVPTVSLYLTPGTHYIEIVVTNAVAGTSNPIGLGVVGTISTGSSNNYIVDRDNYPSYVCQSCQPPCSDCNTQNIVPKVIDASGDLTCSQIFDNGTSVGINKTSGFTYTYNPGSPPPFTGGSPTSGTVLLDVNGMFRSSSIVATSDAKYKTNVTALNNSLEQVMLLRPVEYNWKTDAYPNKGFDGFKHSGFIAQELAEVLPNSVIIDNIGDYAVDYNSIIPVLTQAIQQQQQLINELQDKVKALENNKATSTNALSTQTGNTLGQNTPNPFNNETIIPYNIVSVTSTAYIAIYTLNGEQLVRHDISNSGKGQVTINANELSAGMYLYSLVVDGVEVDTKKMILSK